MKNLILTLLLCLISLPAFAEKDKESVYDRVMESRTLRCGYLSWRYFIDVDPATGDISGIIYDYMEALGKNLSLKIEWVEEVGRADYMPALENGRFDAYCTALTGTAERARMSDFVQPILVNLFNVYVQEGDTRFDNNLDSLNSPDLKMVSAEGDVFSKIIRSQFPKVRLIELPQLSSDADPLLQLSTKKVDAIVMNSHIASEFIKNNPRKIRKVIVDKPLRYIPVSIATKTDEYRFTKMLDVATRELIDNGTMTKILEKYGSVGDAFLEIARPYEVK